MAQLMLLPLTVSCFSKIQIGFTFLVPAHPGSPGHMAVKRASVCNTTVNNCAEFITWNFDDKIFGHILQIWLVHGDAAGGSESVHVAVDAIHRKHRAASSYSLQWKHDL